MNSRRAVIIQARANSSRLPGKMLLPFHADKPILSILLNELLSVFTPDQIVLATTSSPLDESLVMIARSFNVRVFQGAENDVAGRFLGVCNKFGIEHIVRVCADNPLIQPDLLLAMMEVGIESDADYVSYRFADGVPAIKSHIGMFGEYITKSGLKKSIEQSAGDQWYAEHVTNYIYEHPSEFYIKWLPMPNQIEGRKDIRLTIDTIRDFELMQNLYRKLGGDYSIQNVVKTVDLNVEFLQAMKAEIESNKK